MEELEGFFRWLYEAHDVNITIGYDAYDRAQYLRGLWTTIRLSVICIVLSLFIGVLGAWAQGARFAPIRWAMHGYVAFFRNTPPLIQLYFFFFALGSVLPALVGSEGSRPLIGNFAWAVVALSLFAGALNVEIFRSGIEAVPQTTVDAAESLGYTRLQAYAYVILPLALRISLPALGTNLVNLVKTTTLAYAIAVPELLYVSAQIWSEQLNVREMMNVVLLSYVGLVAILVWVLHRWERALRVPGFGEDA